MNLREREGGKKGGDEDEEKVQKGSDAGRRKREGGKHLNLEAMINIPHTQYQSIMLHDIYIYILYTVYIHILYIY